MGKNSTSSSIGNNSSTAVERFLQRFDSNPVGQQVILLWKQYYPSLKPWNEFLDSKRLNRPKDINEAIGRFNHNVMQYKVNYSLVICGLLVYVLITNLFLLITLIVLGYGVLFASSMPPDSKVSIGSVSLTQKQFYGALVGASIPLLWLSSAGQTLFWIVGASAVLVGGHGCCMEKTIEQEYQEP